MKRGRPREEKREKVTMTILPTTDKAIRSRIKDKGTMGKVVDHAMKGYKS